jgi:hypothetical protein
MTEQKPRLALDLDVLAEGGKTGAYRVCERLCVGLAASPQLAVQLMADATRLADADAGLRAGGLTGSLQPIEASPSRKTDIAMSFFRPESQAWHEDRTVVHAHVIYDLIAIARPELFSSTAAKSAHDLVSSLDQRSLVFTLSEFARRELLRFRPDLSPAQIAVIPPATSAWFEPCEDAARRAAVRAKHGIPAGVPCVLGGASAQPHEALDRLVRAFLEAARQTSSSNLHLVLVADPDAQREAVEAALASAGEQRARIVVVPAQQIENADLSALYSDALCFVDLLQGAGAGLAPLEAMACGTPVVCAGDAAFSETVADAGVLVDADDVQAVARAIAQLATAPDQRQALAASALRRARLFDRAHCIARVTEVLRDTCERYRVWPSSLLWQRQTGPVREGRAPVLEQRPFPLATYLAYENGAQGPNFGIALRDDGRLGREWPLWRDTLVASGAAGRVEGGLRTRGVLKSGTPDEPLISYVTVVRNNVATLERAIESVQRQTYRNVEHIVLDGASTDGTVDLILRHAEQLDYFVSEPDRGLYDAINKAVPLARGQLICILNSDDWLEPHSAEIAVHRMRGLTDAPTLLFTGALVHEVTGKPVVEWPPAFVHPGSYFTCASDCHNGIYATPSAYEHSGPYDASYKIAADFKWIMTSLDAGIRFVYTQEVAIHYSLGGTSGDAVGHSRDCLRVVSDRFPFLTSEEVRGLYDGYFGFEHQLPAEPVPRGEPLTLFLRRVFADHVDRPDFQAAVAWAAMVTLQHPKDAPAAVPVAAHAVPSIRRSAKDLAKGLLHRSPFLYNAAIRCYARLRR